MLRNHTPRIITAGIALSLLVSSAASAQLEDDPIPLPIDDVQTAVVLNETSDALINTIIDEAARAAHEEIGGVIADGKRNGYFQATLPERREVVLQAVEFADDGTNVILISGGDSGDTVGVAARNAQTTFIDLGQPVPCVDAEGRRDPTNECLGGSAALPPNYSAVTFEVEDPAYLAGVIAASASRDDRLGIISGMSDCEECNRYIQGFILGARSVDPEIVIELAYLADDSEALAFGDPTAARTFADAFIDVYQPDVLLPVANGASIGMIEAACDAGIVAIGTGVDVAALHPDLAECVLASVTTDVATGVRHSIYEFSNGDLPRVREMTLSDGYVDLTDEWGTRSALPVDVSERYQRARDALITGSVESCPTACGQPVGPDGMPISAATGVEHTAEGSEASAAPSEVPAAG